MYAVGSLTFYASGSKGSQVRADGNGGSLKRGWYARAAKGLKGPFPTEYQAIFAVGEEREAADMERALMETEGAHTRPDTFESPDGLWSY